MFFSSRRIASVKLERAAVATSTGTICKPRDRIALHQLSAKQLELPACTGAPLDEPELLPVAKSNERDQMAGTAGGLLLDFLAAGIPICFLCALPLMLSRAYCFVRAIDQRVSSD